jgi:transcriptional regulator with XRE-family HTH domain
MPTSIPTIAIDSTLVKKKVGENIEQLRLQQKKSVKEMAFLLNLTHSGYRNIERGKTEITITKVFQIADILNGHFFQLLDFENNYVPNNNSINVQIIETLKARIQEYKEENLFMRKQLELTMRKENIII